MKTIGLLGGMSWESTLSYYRLLNEGVKAAKGGLHSAKIALYSVDFAEIEHYQHQGDWDSAAKALAAAAVKVQAAGADFLLIGTNTMHKVAPEIEAALSIPLLHIADATAAALKARNIRRVGLLGTAFTMEQDFYKGRLQNRHGIEVLVPNSEQRALVHQVIYNELCLGVISEASRRAFLAIIASLVADGAEGVILGCTEIGLLLSQSDTPTPLFDTTAIHTEQAVARALAE
ncbi:aspartate/glutamate racemase family protein [Gallaecimonas mangrovi]|uniref:aspartate/glutamate racemase family protein n=1 Tax=Gallaecimonas mangrovi TaxID=2291597 RepID=UPI000E20348B|nr:aspartate/glutamate racemase family protein [Gallaecimonas mangrovi]